MKGFYIEVANNLLDPSHVQKMGQSVWLFMWFLDKMTSIDENGVGKVLGGKPIKFTEIENELGISDRTYTRWLSILQKNGYVETIRTPYGYTVKVLKAKKRFAQRYDKSGGSLRHRDTTKIVRDTTKSVERTEHVADVNKDKTGQDKDKEDKIKNKYHLPPKEKIKKVSEIGNFIRGICEEKTVEASNVMESHNIVPRIPTDTHNALCYTNQSGQDTSHKTYMGITRQPPRADI